MIEKSLHSFFWDADPSQLDIRKNKSYIIERLLELGDERAVQWLFSTYSLKEIRRVLDNSRSLSPKSRQFWEIMLETSRFNTSKISLFQYDYPIIRRHHVYKKIKVASLEDIGCMKIEAISARGKKRDFTDLYFILTKKKMALEDFLSLFKLKYQRTEHNLFHILKSLVYFKDADMDPDLMMMTDIPWEDIKNFFIAQIKEFKIGNT